METSSGRKRLKPTPVAFERLLQVKFANGLRPSIQRGKLVFKAATKRKASRSNTASSRALSSINGTWHRFHTSSPKKLEALMDRARKRKPKRTLPDLLSYYVLYLDPSEEALAAINNLNALKEVDFVDLMPKSCPLPTAPQFQSAGNVTGFFQGYLEGYDLANNETGIGAVSAWAKGLSGAGINFCVVGYNFNKNHRELRDRVTILGGDPVNPANLDADSVASHSTCVLGELGSKKSDDQGTVGIAYGANLYFSAVITFLWPNIGDAISRAAMQFKEGDIIIVEQQISGPGRDSDAEDQEGLVAVEWDKGIYDAIVVALAAGVTVVEPAGNGTQDFDSQLFYRAGINRGHHPFLRKNDSGAIIVGAGGSSTQVRASFSNFGARVDLQGWGDSIVTASGPTVQSDLWTEDGVNREYTRSFGGTSGAAPIVAGACALVQQAFKLKYGRAATCEELRALLVSTGNPQQSNDNGVTQKIGPLPDVKKALEFVSGLVWPPVFDPDPAAVYEAPLEVRIAYGGATNRTNATIRFTTDLSEPTEQSPKFITTGVNRTRLSLSESKLIKAKIFLNDPDPFDGTPKASHVAHGNYQIYDASLPTPDLYFYEIDDYSGDYVIRIHVATGYTLGVDAMIWYNIDQVTDPVQFQGPNVMYMGRIKLSQSGTYSLRSRYYNYDANLETWTPGPVAIDTFSF